MNRHLKILAVFSFALLFFLSCGAIGGLVNPFVGKWESGVFDLEFKGDKSFKLMIGKTISVNLEGTYDYDKDKETLTLDIQGESDVTFTYEFKDDKKKLILKPESDFNYINSKIEFTKE